MSGSDKRSDDGETAFKCNDEEPMTQPVYHHKFSPWRVVGEQRIVAAESTWQKPIKWNVDCEAPGYRPRVLVDVDVCEDWPGRVSTHDGGELIINPDGAWMAQDKCLSRAPRGSRFATLDDVRARLAGVWDATPNLDWIVFTKRPENIRRMLPEVEGEGAYTPAYVSFGEIVGPDYTPAYLRANLWLGVSIACQDDADRLIPELLKCRDLCAKTFLSIEPLLDDIDIRKWLTWELDVDESRPPGHFTRRKTGPDWVIVGGESGPNARPCHVAWIRSIVRQCRAAGVPCFVKQLGARVRCASVMDLRLGTAMRCLGHEGDPSESYAPILRDKKGGDPAEWPEDLRVREVPQ